MYFMYCVFDKTSLSLSCSLSIIIFVLYLINFDYCNTQLITNKLALVFAICLLAEKIIQYTLILKIVTIRKEKHINFISY